MIERGLDGGSRVTARRTWTQSYIVQRVVAEVGPEVMPVIGASVERESTQDMLNG